MIIVSNTNTIEFNSTNRISINTGKYTNNEYIQILSHNINYTKLCVPKNII